MIWKYWLVLFLMFVEDAESKSISILVNHKKTFAVIDEEPLKYIKLPDVFEEQLLLDRGNPLGTNQPQDNRWKSKNTDLQKDTPDGVEISKTIPENPYTDDDDDDNDDDYEADGNVIDTQEEAKALYDTFFNHQNTDDEDYAKNADDASDVGHVTKNDGTSDDFDFEDSFDANGHDFAKFDDVINNDESVNAISRKKQHNRRRRSAQEQWKNSLPGGAPSAGKVDTEPDVWEEVTDDDIAAAQVVKYKQVAEYVGITLLSVLLFVFIGVCFMRDPMACIFAFGSGCPCCIVFCPCLRAFTDKYLDVKKMVREKMNKYMPGVIVREDGTLDYYEPTAEEMEILAEIYEEIDDS